MSAAGKPKVLASVSVDLVTQPITFPVTVDEIAKLRATLAPLLDKDANDPDVYEEIRTAVGQLVSTRTAIEDRRVYLKADALEYGRNVDAAAKVLRTAISELEEPLKAKKKAVDDEAERVKREKEKADLLALEAKLKAEREAAEAAAKVQREAEEKRLAEERARHEAERAAFAKAQAEADEKRKREEAVLAAQRAEVEAAQRKLDQEKAAARAEEEKRQAAIRAEEEARAAAERAKVEAEAAARAAAEEAARVEAMRPDVEKVRAWAPAFRVLAEGAPEVSAPEAQAVLAWAVGRLLKTADTLEGFTGTEGR